MEPLPAEHARAIIHLMKLTADVRSIEGLDQEAVRAAARWILDRYSGLRAELPLDCKLGLGSPL